MKLIGKGTFTKAYLREDGKVLVKSEDPMKELLALGWGSKHPMFPECERTEEDFEYLMPYYERPKSLKRALEPRQYRLYLELRKLHAFHFNSNMLIYAWHEAFDSIPDEFAEEREALKEHLDGCGCYGSDVCFEISPRNVAVKNGKLILLDCFYLRSKLMEASNRKLRYAY